jgi:hypothetical protein
MHGSRWTLALAAAVVALAALARAKVCFHDQPFPQLTSLRGTFGATSLAGWPQFSNVTDALQIAASYAFVK